ncbi:hypothetical protein FACS189494_09330 [Spirochaetia bacterium]|nr:hypothetical protein FACS189494_09330 [Spirochaetia bacterium]
MKAHRIKTVYKAVGINYRKEKAPSLTALLRAHKEGMSAERTALGIAGLGFSGNFAAIKHLIDNCDKPEYNALLWATESEAKEAVKQWKQE